MTHKSRFFYGNEISKHGIENGYVDYCALAKSFQHILNNDILKVASEYDQISGCIDNSDKIDELNDMLDELNEQLNDKESELADMFDEDDNGVFVNSQEEFKKVSEEVDDLKSKILDIEAEIYDLENESQPEIFQFYIVDENGAKILEEAEEIVFDVRIGGYDGCQMYVWGVTHFGTSWDYVCTNIKLELD